MITVEDYLMGRDMEYPLTEEMRANVADLLSRVNYLIGRLNIPSKVSSGYRPGIYNIRAGGAKASAHLTCKGVDILDPFGKTAELLMRRVELLEQCGLYMENPNYTKKTIDGKTTHWIHLDTVKRNNRVFIPY